MIPCNMYMYNYVSFILDKVGAYQLYYDCRCILTALQLLVNVGLFKAMTAD